MDAGSLRRAREMEALGFLQIALAAAQEIAWTGGFTSADEVAGPPGPSDPAGRSTTGAKTKGGRNDPARRLPAPGREPPPSARR